jgi:hypothetical protein
MEWVLAVPVRNRRRKAGPRELLDNGGVAAAHGLVQRCSAVGVGLVRHGIEHAAALQLGEHGCMAFSGCDVHRRVQP